jgi:hypothetical protein
MIMMIPDIKIDKTLYLLGTLGTTPHISSVVENHSKHLSPPLLQKEELRKKVSI